MMSRVSGRVAIPLVLVAGVALAACTSDKAAASPVTLPTTPTIDIGQIGELPPRDQVGEDVHLVLPRTLLRIPGSFPLGSVVGFHVPVRNDGAEPIEIRRLEPG